MALRRNCRSTRRKNSECSRRRRFALWIGDRIRFTKNVKHRGQKFLKNELRTVVAIDQGKIVFDKGEFVRNGEVATSLLALRLQKTCQS